jgi:phage/plasmid-associated DNA primase
VVLVAELDAELRLNEALVKLFTSGGADKLSVRGCGVAEVRAVDIFFKLILISNHLVRLSEHVDRATLGRVNIYSYQTQFDIASPVAQAVQRMIEKVEFHDEVFSWLVEGAMKWYQLGHTPVCQISDEAKKNYEAEQSPLDAFLADTEWCERVPPACTANEKNEYKVSKSMLLERCTKWYQSKTAEGIYPPRVFPKIQELKRFMEERGFREQQGLFPTGVENQTKRARGFFGLKLLPLPQADEDALA